MKKILISACLYGGGTYRYDGKDKSSDDPLILKWKEEGRLVPVCPEIMGGLSVPRDPSERAGERVVSSSGRDVTAEYELGAAEALKRAKAEGAVCAVLKEGSPSCGVRTVYDGTHTGKKMAGRGVTTELLEKNGIPVFSEDECEKVLMFIKLR